MVRRKLMFYKIIILFFLIFIISFKLNAETNIDQWEDTDKTYKDLVDDGFEVKSYDISTLKTESGLTILFFVTVLQKDKEVFECQEYQTIDKDMTTLDLSFVCRKITQPYNLGIGT